jgi:hypothetical protein
VQIRAIAPGLPAGGAAPAAFAGDPDLETFCGLFFANATCAVGNGEVAHELELVGVGPLAAEVFSAYEVASGSDLARADADEALVPAALAAELSLHASATRSRCGASRRRAASAGRKWVAGRAARPRRGAAIRVVGLSPAGLGGARPRRPVRGGAALYADAPLLPLYRGRLAPGPRPSTTCASAWRASWSSGRRGR